MPALSAARQGPCTYIRLVLQLSIDCARPISMPAEWRSIELQLGQMKDRISTQTSLIGCIAKIDKHYSPDPVAVDR